MITTSAVSATTILLVNARDAQLGPDSEMAASILVGMHLDDEIEERSQRGSLDTPRRVLPVWLRPADTPIGVVLIHATPGLRPSRPP